VLSEITRWSSLCVLVEKAFRWDLKMCNNREPHTIITVQLSRFRIMWLYLRHLQMGVDWYLDWPLISPRSILDLQSIDTLVETWSTLHAQLGWQLAESRLSFNRFMSWLTLGQLICYWPNYCWSRVESKNVNCVWLRCQSRILINAWSLMPWEHMIQVLCNNSNQSCILISFYIWSIGGQTSW